VALFSSGTFWGKFIPQNTHLKFRELVIHKLFTATIYLFIPIIFPKFFGKNFNRSLVFGNKIFSNLMKKN